MSYSSAWPEIARPRPPKRRPPVLFLAPGDHGVAVTGQPSAALGDQRSVHAGWSWDGSTLVASNCRFGFYPLFWRDTGSGVALSTNPLALIERNHALDLPALAVFTRLGFFVGDDTPFVGIRQLPPNSRLVWQPGRPARVAVGQREAATPVAAARDGAIAAYADLFDRAVERTLPVPDDCYLPLSGGRDSRHIALALDKAGVRPKAFVTLKHLPWRPDEDARIAALVARALGVPHVIIEQPAFVVRNILRSFIESGMCADEGGHLPPMLDWLRSRARCIYDGIAGDMMSAGLFQTAELHDLFRRGRLDEICTHLFRAWGSSVGGWEGMIDAGLADALNENLARERLKTELEQHVTHHNPSRSFYFWNRTRREIALAFELYAGIEVRTPYLDPELWRFLDALPFELVADHQFHTETIRRAYPSFSVPFEDKRVRRPHSRKESLLFGLDFIRASLGARGLRQLPLLRRSARLLIKHDTWWSPTIALYLATLLRIARGGRDAFAACEHT